MALKKNMPTLFGTDFEYHKIKSVALNFDTAPAVTISVESFADKEARKEEKQSVHSEFRVSNYDMTEFMAGLYEVLKTKFPLFSDAEDDFDDDWKDRVEKVTYEQFVNNKHNVWTENKIKE